MWALLMAGWLAAQGAPPAEPPPETEETVAAVDDAAPEADASKESSEAEPTEDAEASGANSEAKPTEDAEASEESSGTKPAEEGAASEESSEAKPTEQAEAEEGKDSEVEATEAAASEETTSSEAATAEADEAAATEAAAEEPAGVEEIRATAVEPESGAVEAPEAEAETGARAESNAPLSAVLSGEVVGDADGRFWRVSGTVMYRALAIRDEDPANDQMLLYRLSGSVAVAGGVRAMVGLGLTERFVAEVDESGFLLHDLSFGAMYPHSVALPMHWVELPDRDLKLLHRLQLFVPTSRVSQAREMYAATRLTSTATVDIDWGLSAHVSALLQYAFMRYAERDSRDGGMNNQLAAAPSFGVDYALELPDLVPGAFFAGLELSTTYIKRYASREEYDSPLSSQTFWTQEYGWGVSAGYAPWSYLNVAIGLEHGMPLLLNGIIQRKAFHRDYTEMVLRVTGTY